MNTIADCLNAANEFKNKMNEKKKIRKLLKRWSPRIHFETRESDIKITLEITGGIVASVYEGHIGDADLVVPSVSKL